MEINKLKIKKILVKLMRREARNKYSFDKEIESRVRRLDGRRSAF
jgi:hypothetical protein